MAASFRPIHPAAPAQNRLHPPVTVATPQAEVTTIASLASSGDLHLYAPSSCRNLFPEAPSSSVLNSGDLHLHDPAPVGDPHPAQPDLSSPPMSPTYINLISPSPTLYASPPTADTNTVVTYCPVRPNAEQKMYNTDDTVSEDFNASPTAPKPLTAFDLVMNDMSFFDVDTIAFTNSPNIQAAINAQFPLAESFIEARRSDDGGNKWLKQRDAETGRDLGLQLEDRNAYIMHPPRV